MFNNILTHFGLNPTHYTVQPFGSGLINHTCTISTHDGRPCYILQQINTAVFRHPSAIAENISTLANYLQQHAPGYLFAGALPATNGSYLYIDEKNQYFRLFPFI